MTNLINAINEKELQIKEFTTASNTQLELLAQKYASATRAELIAIAREDNVRLANGKQADKNAPKSAIIDALVQVERVSQESTMATLQAELAELKTQESQAVDAYPYVHETCVTEVTHRPLAYPYFVKEHKNGSFEVYVLGELIATERTMKKARLACAKHSPRVIAEGFTVEKGNDGRYYPKRRYESPIRGTQWAYLNDENHNDRIISYLKKEDAEKFTFRYAAKQRAADLN